MKYVMILIVLVLLYLFYIHNKNNKLIDVNKIGLNLLNMYNYDNIPVKNNNYYEVELIKKDTMGKNNINTDSYYVYDNNLDQPYTAWSDEKSFSSPNYYKRVLNDYKIGNEIHYDDSNKLLINSRNSILSGKNNNVKKYPNSKCYIDKNNVNVCDFYNTYKKVPYSLYNVNNNGEPVQKKIINTSISNVSNDLYNTLNYEDDKVQNGGNFYKNVNNNNVSGSNKVNENNSVNINEQVVIFN
jgi:hypothetical protein